MTADEASNDRSNQRTWAEFKVPKEDGTYNIKVRLDLANTLPTTSGDPIQLQQPLLDTNRAASLGGPNLYVDCAIDRPSGCSSFGQAGFLTSSFTRGIAFD